jgi:hypothetical protein
MDATQKMRIRKVTLSHFTATVVCGILFVFVLIADAGKIHAHQNHAWTQAWCSFFGKIGLTLQPQLYFFVHANLGQVSEWQERLIKLVASASIPLWSICFGWIFVKLDKWLNHFPVLGKKVF